MAVVRECSYDPPAYNRDLVKKLDGAVKDGGLPYLRRSGEHALGTNIRRIGNWSNWHTNDADQYVCDLSSSNIDDVVARDGVAIFPANQDYLRCDLSLRPSLRAFIYNTSYFSREFGGAMGDIHVLGHGGGLRPYPGVDSYHYQAKALDIYWIGWSNEAQHVAARPCNAAVEISTRPTNHRRLVAVEAGLRKWFSYVLNRDIDDHHHHFHVDNGCPSIALRVRKGTTDNWVYTSCHYFIQDCINAFTDMQIPYDGQWGSDTQRGYEVLLSDFGMELLDPIANINEYLLFLDYVMMHGFADSRAGSFRWAGDVPWEGDVLP